jgi:rfaE bifunctional protein nucleotidyltransferase chain/domain
MSKSKIASSEEISRIAGEQARAGKTVGFTNGCFDILHVGHVRYLQEARSKCDILVVGVNSDASVKRLKGQERPINPEYARVEVLAALESVDHVTLFEEDTPERLIKELNPAVIFKGGDWKEEDVVGAAYVRSKGGKVSIISYVDGFSTTKTIKRMKNG